MYINEVRRIVAAAAGWSSPVGAMPPTVERTVRTPSADDVAPTGTFSEFVDRLNEIGPRAGDFVRHR